MATTTRLAGRVIAASLTAALSVAAFAPATTHAESVHVPWWQDTPAASRLEPLTPCRLADTRTEDRRPAAGATFEVLVAGRCNVPADAAAVSLTVTATNTTADGYVTVTPTPAAGAVSTLNYREGETRANSTLVSLSGKGTVAVFTLASADVIVDVAAAFVPTAPGEFVTAGRFNARPRRLADTRHAGSRQQLRVAAPRGASAVAVNVTVVASKAAGFVTVHPSDVEPPTASVVNVDGPGQTRSAGTIVPVGPDGKFTVTQTASGGDLIVDMSGWFTGDGEYPGVSGLFVPVDPTRVLDTRIDGEPLHADRQNTRVPNDQPAEKASAVAANVTVLPVDDMPAYAALHQGTWRSSTSLVNVTPGDAAVANFGMTGVVGRRWGVMAGANDVHVVVDLAGWFTPAPVPPKVDPPAGGNDDQWVYDRMREVLPEGLLDWYYRNGGEVAAMDLGWLDARGAHYPGYTKQDGTQLRSYIVYDTFRRPDANPYSVLLHEFTHALHHLRSSERPEWGTRDNLQFTECLAEASGLAFLGETVEQQTYVSSGLCSPDFIESLIPTVTDLFTIVPPGGWDGVLPA